MNGRDDRASLVDMLNHAEEAVVLLGEASLNDLAEDRVMELALRKLVEIVGEAANRVSEETQHCHQEIPSRNSLAPDHWNAQPTGSRLR